VLAASRAGSQRADAYSVVPVWRLNPRERLAVGPLTCPGLAWRLGAALARPQLVLVWAGAPQCLGLVTSWFGSPRALVAGARSL
jgi:hypothetical protein